MTEHLIARVAQFAYFGNIPLSSTARLGRALGRIERHRAGFAFSFVPIRQAGLKAYLLLQTS
jgi:hypothetical protein